MSEEKHTDTRLIVELCDNLSIDQWFLFDENGIGHVARVSSGLTPDPTGEANARRLAACWNACQGLSTEDLEKGAVERLIAERDRLRHDCRAAAGAIREAMKSLPGALSGDLDDIANGLEDVGREGGTER